MKGGKDCELPKVTSVTGVNMDVVPVAAFIPLKQLISFQADTLERDFFSNSLMFQ